MSTGGWHYWAHVGTGGRIAGDRWAHCWAQVGALLGTGWRNLCVALLGTVMCADEALVGCTDEAALIDGHY
ncbi:unnamed protein product [Staurois parvus]|uniref:Uncharacterized protein n=1 Tax=Staurois parvus TaxID=386267 RepID=A0ABN9FT06_9NEOB|nr:unnamed protein product [Staurois parvus]